MTEALWDIVTGSRNGILATVGEDGLPQLSNIYYLPDMATRTLRFSTTTVRAKGRNLLRDPRASIHVSGRNFLNFAVVAGPVSLAVAREPDDQAVEALFEIHVSLGAGPEREGFGEQMLAAQRMAVELHMQYIYGQVLDQKPRATEPNDIKGGQ